VNETAIRQLLRQAMAGPEPPPAQHILGGAVRAARRTRRRHRAAGIGAAAIMVPGLAVGVPVAVGALHPGGSGTHPRIFPSARPHHSQRPHHSSPPRIRLIFRQPGPLAQHAEVNPVPITSQSFGQRLVDDLPAGTRMSVLQADDNFNGTGVAYAYFNKVSTRIGAGLLQATMMKVGQKQFDFGCGPVRSRTCREYRLRGGVVVCEQYEAGLMISVFRPGVAEFQVSEDDVAEAAYSKPSRGMPLTVGQLLKIALDGRWQFTMSQSFVQRAAGLHIVPIGTLGDYRTDKKGKM
jgi:hypothetical protein